jgi:hypothetical protein
MAEFQEKSNFMQTLITAVVGVAVAAVGWSFIRKWMNKKEEQQHAAASEPRVVAALPQSSSQPTQSSPSREPADLTKFSDAMSVTDARTLANDTTKIPSDVARLHVNTILDQITETDKKRSVLGKYEGFSVGQVLEEARKGGDESRYVFLNVLSIKNVDKIATTPEQAQKYFPKMGAEEYKALRTFVDKAKETGADVNQAFPAPYVGAMIKSMKKFRAQDIKHEAEKTGSLQGLDEKLAEAGLSGYIGSSADVIGVQTPVAAAAAGGGESVATRR